MAGGNYGFTDFPEFPLRSLTGDVVVKVENFDTVRTLEDEFLGYLSYPWTLRNYVENFLDKFKVSKSSGFYLIKFKTLFVGYWFFKMKKEEAFERIQKTAQTEEEFCALAGVS